MDQIYEELRRENPEIFYEIYEKASPDSTAESNHPGGSSSDSNLKTSDFNFVYVNRTKPIEVINPMNGRRTCEYAFVCVVKEDFLVSKKFVKIYVSEEYNVRDQSNPANAYFAGRFLFVPTPGRTESQPVAMAEEPVTVLCATVSQLESLYLERKHVREPGKILKSL